MNTNLNIDREALESAIDEGRSVLSDLLRSDAIPFRGMTGITLPEESGIYVIVHQKTGIFLYAGETDKGLKSRIWAGHRTANGKSDLAQILVNNNIVKTIADGRKWMEDRCVVLYLTKSEFDMNVKIAEHFIISVLRPIFNK